MKIELTGFKVSVENKNIPIDNLISKKYKILKEDINELAKIAAKEANPLYPVPKLFTAKELESIYLEILK